MGTTADQATMRQHAATDRVELGYARRVCRRCDTDWPCPDYAQARERYWALCDACGESPCGCRGKETS